MKISKELKAQAAEAAKSLGVNTIYVNDKEEMFTVENLALNSVGSDKERVETLTFATDAGSGSDSSSENNVQSTNEAGQEGGVDGASANEAGAASSPSTTEVKPPKTKAPKK